MLARRDFWRLYCRSEEPLDDPSLARSLFFAGMLHEIEPAEDPASLALVSSLEGIARTMVLKQLALASLPRVELRIEIANTHAWTITFGPQGSIAHALDGLELGADDAHASLPLLRLAEVRAIARACTGGDVPREYIPLLLLPVAGLSPEDLDEARADVRASRLDAAIDLVLEVLEAAPPAHWRLDPTYGFIVDVDTSFRNPYGVHYGSAWRELAEQTGNPAHAATAAEIAAAAWRADREFARLRAFFETLG